MLSSHFQHNVQNIAPFLPFTAGLGSVEQQQINQTYDIYANHLQQRDQKASLIITSQFGFDLWYDEIGEETIADALLDHIVPLFHKIILDGNTFRGAEGVIGGADHGKQ